MTESPLEFLKKNPKLNYKAMSLEELNQLPVHTGILNFKIKKTNFLILNVQNDDASAVRFFWQGEHDSKILDLWYDICNKNDGFFIDVGAHTGLFTLTALKANINNKVIAIEPYYLNAARLIANLRLNGLTNRAQLKLQAASNKEGISKFKVVSESTFLSKGGRIDKTGNIIEMIKLDNLKIKNKIKGIKIDTEGEDFQVLIGAEKIIKSQKPHIIIEVRNNNKKQIQDFFNLHKYNLYKADLDKNSINLNNINIESVENVYAESN